MAIRLAKRSLYDNAECDLKSSLERETFSQNIASSTEDAREGIRAFVEKRDPSSRAAEPHPRQGEEPMDLQRPLPTPITPEAKPYWDGAREGKLMVPKCQACGKAFLYPRVLCPFCASRDIRGSRPAAAASSSPSRSPTRSSTRRSR